MIRETPTRLFVDLSTANASGPGGVNAEIWLAYDGAGFPAIGSRVAVIVVLSWWAEAAINLLDGVSRHETVRFMEGPLQVEIAGQGEGIWDLALVHRRTGAGTSSKRTSTDSRTLVSSVIDASESTIALCNRNGWLGEDSAILERTVEQLRSRVQRVN